MKACINTSALVKKCVEEKGSAGLGSQREALDEIIVTPSHRIKVNAAFPKRLKEKALIPRQTSEIHQTTQKDLPYFSKVLGNERLEEEAQDDKKVETSKGIS